MRVENFSLDPEKTMSDAPTPAGGLRYILAPAGKCPVKLASADPEDVAAWAQSVIDLGVEEGALYSFEALRYWLRREEMHTSEAEDYLPRARKIEPTEQDGSD